ncbi:MAG TPA: acyltransferase [Mucilaginibacter sp.]|jgi:peptidoglycan/LPS O-acetylase OafA/YrhL|nr:acyltransferase [Mucilaginibacter sp.]
MLVTAKRPRSKRARFLFTGINEVPTVLQKNHFPTLDGLRCFSILLVVFYHLELSQTPIYGLVFNGELGVNIFFVLSGFLITTLCIKEKLVTSTLNLGKFYLRRVLRILPVAYLFLLVVFILNLFLKLHLDYINFLGAALFIYNFAFFRHYKNSFAIGHYWSLATEEQFYILFPAILKKNYVAFLVCILTISILVPVFIYVQYYISPLNRTVLLFTTHYLIKFNGIACGCLYSILVFKGYFDKIGTLRYRLVINLIIILLLFFLDFRAAFDIDHIATNTIISLLTGLFIAMNIYSSNDIVYKLLNSKIAIKIGVLSYSIYIWQQIFTLPILPKPLSLFPYNLLFLAIVSYLSYHFYERYFINLKKRFQRIKN